MTRLDYGGIYHKSVFKHGCGVISLFRSASHTPLMKNTQFPDKIVCVSFHIFDAMHRKMAH